MTCEERQELFELYSLGLLDAPERDEIDQHLAAGCDACTHALKEALALNAMLLAQAPEVAPPARLKRRLLASVGVEHRGWGWTAALAAAAMLVVALWLSVVEQRKEHELADVRKTLVSANADHDRVQQALAILDEPDARQVAFGKSPSDPQGNVFIQARRGVLLVGTNLPQLPAGKTYEMWMIPKGPSPVAQPAGLFHSDASGSAMHLAAGPVDTTTLGTVAVTVEPEAGSSTPTTAPIIVAALAL